MSDIKCRILCVDDHLDTSEMLQPFSPKKIMKFAPQQRLKRPLPWRKVRNLISTCSTSVYYGTGVELCKTLNLLTPGVPCIFYSGDAYEIHRQKALQGRCCCICSKT